MNSENSIYEYFDGEGDFLNKLPKQMPYDVPENYFASFSFILIETLRTLDKKEIVPDWGKKMPYDVPAGYFANVSEKVSEAISDESAGQLPPKKEVYDVPQGYFDNLPLRALAAAKAANIKSRPFTPFGIRWNTLKTAVAAVLIVAIGIGIYGIINRNNDSKFDDKMNNLTKSDIKEYLIQNYADADTALTAINDEDGSLKFENKEIIQYLNENGWDGVE